MLNVLGHSDSEESKAADTLKSAIELAWPWIKDSEASSITLIPNVQCYGQQTRDIDLVVLADIAYQDLPFAVFRPGAKSLFSAGVPPTATKIAVRSLCLVIEVKDHPPGGVRFDGGRVSVFYAKDKRWHDASQQSERQKYALKGYIERHRASAPRITNLVWLRNIERAALPSNINNLLPAQVTWTSLLNTVVENHRPRNDNGSYAIDHEPSPTHGWSLRDCERILAKRLEPTALDRRRLEAVCKGTLDQGLLAAVGHRLVLLSGRGGTGKTIILLRLAYKNSLDGGRAIVLTYNQALRSDVERLLVLTGIRDDIAAGTVVVSTVQSFTLKLLKLLGIVETSLPEDFLEDYDKILGEALEYLRGGAVTRNDISALIQSRPEDFDWELVLLDEAQDWPDQERDFVRAIYEPGRLVVADGREQLVRQSQNCDWKHGLRKDQYEVIQCVKSYRLKRNLAVFANSMAAALGLPHWTVDENDDLPGGQVIVVEGDYFAIPHLHADLVAGCSKLGNKPIDMLACIPPRGDYREQARFDAVLAHFKQLEQPLWDGTDALVRRAPPTDASELRLVQYESCRGLEGWTTINLGFDDFYDHKSAIARKLGPPPTDGIADMEGWARRFAATWAMIPLTRAIDTIVIEVSPRDSPVMAALRKIHSGSGADFMSWHVG